MKVMWNSTQNSVAVLPPFWHKWIMNQNELVWCEVNEGKSEDNGGVVLSGIPT